MFEARRLRLFHSGRQLCIGGGMRGRDSQLRTAAVATLQLVFAIFVLTCFVLGWAIQLGAIAMPEWTQTFQGVPPEVQSRYAARLMSVVTVLLVLCLVVGTVLVRSDNASGFRP
ncbi:hypothetical protein GGR56DRAFT_668713 [Xylariaceae sp. FL0804]|nr:hypothetical protein GGR56DRAFT_668713 [Xylariaceae sp. FL0804]